MTISDYRKILKVIKNKPGKIKKYEKHNIPRKRSCGIGNNRCEICLRFGGHVGQYGLCLCRHCFRENASKIGFKKFS